MKPPAPFRLITSLVLLLALAMVGPISAATLRWTNTAGGDWNTAANWSPNQLPGPNDDAVFNVAGTGLTRREGLGRVRRVQEPLDRQRFHRAKR